MVSVSPGRSFVTACPIDPNGFSLEPAFESFPSFATKYCFGAAYCTGVVNSSLSVAAFRDAVVFFSSALLKQPRISATALSWTKYFFPGFNPESAAACVLFSVVSWIL